MTERRNYGHPYRTEFFLGIISTLCFMQYMAYLCAKFEFHSAIASWFCKHTNLHLNNINRIESGKRSVVWILLRDTSRIVRTRNKGFASNPRRAARTLNLDYVFPKLRFFRFT